MAQSRVGVLPCQPVVMPGRYGGGTVLVTLGRPSITLVMRVMATGVCFFLGRLITMASTVAMHTGVPSITLVMGVMSPPMVGMPRMLTTCVALILVGAVSFLG